MPGAMDKYANIITKRITLSAANTFTTDAIDMGLSLFDKVGLLISRAEYLPAHSSLQLMTATADNIAMGMITNDSVTSIAIGDNSTIDTVSISRHDNGAAANAHFFQTPIVRDFSGLPGGGLLITPRPWFIAGDSVGLASAAIVDVRIYFTVVKLSSEDYFELLETRHFFGQ